MASRDDLIKLYFDLGLNNNDMICVLCRKHGVILSLRHLQRILQSHHLFRRKNYTSLTDAIIFIRHELKGSGALHGYRWMFQKCLDNGIRVRKEDVRGLLSILDPNGVEERRSRRLHRRSYFAKGPNFIWLVDSYDKLRPFGICINGCIDGFSRRIIWLNVYNTSSDPKIVGGYYVEVVKELGSCPLIVRADRGTENGKICEFQRFLRQNGQDRFGGEKSFMYGRSTSNQRIESWWGFLRKGCCEFWINLFHNMKSEGHFDGDFIDKNIVIFCFLVLIQDELDATVDVWDNHRIRPSKNANVPYGRPNAMYCVPELYDVQDCSSHVDTAEIDACAQQCTFRSSIPCDEDVYRLCCSAMAQQNLQLPKDAYEGLNLYLHLRRSIHALI